MGSRGTSEAAEAEPESTIQQCSRVKDVKSNTLKKLPNISWEGRLSMADPSYLDEATRKLLEGCAATSELPPVDLNTLMQKSESFPLEFPVQSVRISEIRKRISDSTLESHANSVYPLIHEDTLPLIADWLKHKREDGSAVEQALYKEMGLIELIQRLLERRAFCFVGRKDTYMILEVEQDSGGWENIGTDHEVPPLVLENYLSYDEMKLSAMLTISSHTEFINDGSRKNRGIVVTGSNDLEPRGVIIGVVGSRFHRPNVMEYQDIAVARDQNTLKNGYGQIRETSSNVKSETSLQALRRVWARFYGQSHLPTYKEVQEQIRKTPGDPKYVPVRQYICDAENYIKRTLLTAETILLEADARAQEKQTTAYLHVVGFGLGVWKALPDQQVYFLRAFEIALKSLMPKLQHVSDVMFAYLEDNSECGEVKDGSLVGHIRIHFGKRESHIRVEDNKLLVVTYAWDGNSLPGTEFWMGNLGESGRAAAACSTQITELQNPLINPRASGSSLHIVSPEYGILHVADYAKRKLR